jgi:hypothetical protein
MVGKGQRLKSWKNIKVGEHIWVEWWDYTHRLLPIKARIKGGIQVVTENGGLLDVTNPKSCYAVVGEPDAD